MQNPEAFLAAAKSGSVPATWRVLRPKGSYPAGAGCGGAFVGFFILFLGIIVSFFIRVISETTSPSTGSFNASDPGAFFTSFLPVSLPVLIGGGVGLIVVVGLLSARRAIRRLPDSYFAFTQNATLQRAGSH